MSNAESLYVYGDSVFHRLNARATLALVAGFSGAALVFTDPLFVGSVLVFGVLALALAGGLSNLRRVWVIIVALFVVGIVVWPAFTPARGPVVLDVSVLRVTAYELEVALGRSARIVSFIVLGLGFVTTTSNEEIVSGLRSLGVPYAMCFAVGTALRLFPTFLGAANTVRQAQAARGYEVSGGPIERLRGFVPLLIPVFMTAFRNVNTQSMALEARGFDTRGDRTFYNSHPFTARDWAAVVVAGGVLVGSVVLAYGFGVGVV